MSAVRLRGVSVRFPRRGAPALRDVDLDVVPGEALLVTGASGGGKSTLLDVLAGVVPQSVDGDVTGDVRVLGADPRCEPVARGALRTGRVGQDPATGVCLPDVRAEVALPLENRGVPRERIGPRVHEALADVDALHLADRSTSTLSGGELQRVALAAALVGEPELLLLDEPTSMLDPLAAAHVRHLLAARGAGRASVLVEQRVEDPAVLPPRAVVLGAGGRVLADGATSDVLPVPHPWSGRGERRPGRPVLRLREAAVRRGARAVVRVADLTVRAGTVTALVGRNGSGKSSLLLALAGVLPGSGERTGGPAALVLQRPELGFLTRSAAAEVACGAPWAAGPGRPRPWGRRAGRVVPADDPRAAAALAKVGLARQASVDPYRLSGGQRRRLAFAAAVAQERPVLLLDEPTCGLDPVRSAELATLVARHADRGGAVVVATHDLGLARALADDVVVLADGDVLAQGGPDLLDDDGVLVAAGLRAGPGSPGVARRASQGAPGAPVLGASAPVGTRVEVRCGEEPAPGVSVTAVTR